MVECNRTKIEQRIHCFLKEFIPLLDKLIAFLHQAGISHYSSGCGIKSVTFDLFPASEQVERFLGLLTLNRTYFHKSGSGFKDFSPIEGYNPAFFFVKHLKRWTQFASIVMHNEGDSPRGVAAANAKVILDELIARLGNAKRSISLLRRKTSIQLCEFAQLMQDIGHYLIASEQQQQYAYASSTKANYQRALAAVSHQKIA